MFDHPSGNSQALSYSDMVGRPQPIYKILEILPIELVEVVVSHVADINDLRSLARVSKLFQELAEPRIYRDVFIRKGAQASRLTNSLKKKPIRATWVRDLRNVCQFDFFDGLLELNEVVPKMTRLKSLALETPDCNISRSESRRPWIKQQEAYCDIFKTFSEPKNNLLPKLLSCTLHLVDKYVSLYPLNHYSIIFLHPTLMDLTISCAYIDPPRNLHPALHAPSLANTTGLTTLNLIECDIHPQGLYHLLRLPRQLVSLTLTEAIHLDNYDFDRRYCGLGHPNVLHPLHAHQPLLAHLRIARLGTRRDHLFYLPPLDLTPFTQLTSVEFAHIRACNPSAPGPVDCCERIHRFGLPALITGGPQTAFLTYTDVFKAWWEPALKFFTCAFRNKISHGIENLKILKLVLIDHHLVVPERMHEDIRQGMEKMSRGLRALGELGKKDSVGIRVVVEWVKPDGLTIPPYLVGEYMPEVRPEYDSGIEVMANADG